jgi:hypothetical protein
MNILFAVVVVTKDSYTLLSKILNSHLLGMHPLKLNHTI